MNNDDLCIKLVKADSEYEVINILKEAGYWSKKENWKYFGGKENNYGDIGNQQSKADGALVEKLINSVDAVLMAENYHRLYTEKDYEPPPDIKTALQKFFNVDEGKLYNISAYERTKLSNKISLIATGSKINPSYSIVDLGEGQTPNNMSATLLSLGASNKLRIPFVQGKFNMGGTGVLRFCGNNNFELIISKRDPKISIYETDTSSNKWGFTIVRRMDPEDKVRSSTYKYLVDNNEILSFEADSLPILPDKFPKAFGNDLFYGTFIKLYEYQIGNLRTLITLNLNYRLSLLMPQLAIPIRLFERRKDFKANSYETTLSGLDVRLEEDKANNIEEKFKSSGEITVSGQKLKYSIFPFKKGKITNYSTNEGVIFTINGQTHGHLSKSFFKRRRVGLGYLADSLLVVADCSEFSNRAIEILFRNDRETLISCKLKIEIEKSLEDELRNHKGLRLLQEERRRIDIANKLEDSKPLVNILSDILKKSPTLSRLLLQGKRISNPFKIKSSSSINEYVGKEFPSYFTLVKKYNIEKPKEAQYRKRFRMQFKTDASNDYFERSKDPGNFKLFLNGEMVENTSINCWNGFANLTVLIKDHKVGELLQLKSIVSDVKNYAIPFEEDFYVKIIPQRKNGNGGNGNRTPPSSTNKGAENIDIDGFALPRVSIVKRNNWEQHNFDEKSALKVIATGEKNFDFFINLDNVHLLTELKYSNHEEVDIIEARYKYGMVLIALALLNDEESVKNKEDEEIFDQIESLTRRISPILIPMISSLGDLKLEELEDNYN